MKFWKPLYDNPNHCPICNTPFQAKGFYCFICGERHIDREKNTGILVMITDLGSEIVNFINKKVWSTIQFILIPGKLTKAHYYGVRNHVLKPLTILAIIIGAYFLLFENFSLFFVTCEDVNLGYLSHEINTSNTFNINIATKINNKAIELSLTQPELISKIDNRAMKWSKASFWVIWIIFGFAWHQLMKKCGFPYGYHFIFSANIFTIYILLWLLTTSISLYIVQSNYVLFSYLIEVAFLPYFILATLRAYSLNKYKAFVKGIMGWILFYIIFTLYRQAVTIVSLWSIQS